MKGKISLSVPKEVDAILTRIMEHGGQAYIVGGAVRDTILGRSVTDWDVATSLRPDEIERLFSHTRTIPVGKKYGTVIVVMNGRQVQVTTYRGEEEYLDFRHPKRVVFLSDIVADLSRRDFTVNAMAYNPYLTPSLIDPFGGVDDIARKIIRTVGRPDKRFSEDPLRILRGIRFCAELSFQLEHQTMEAAKTHGHLLSRISAERIRDELNRILLASEPYHHLITLCNLGIFDILLPDLAKCFGSSALPSWSGPDPRRLVFKAVNLCRSDIVLRLAVLHYPCQIDQLLCSGMIGLNKLKAADGCAETVELSLRRLRYDRTTIRRILSLVSADPLPLDLNQADAAYRLRKIMGQLGPEDSYRFLELQQTYLLAADRQEEANGIYRYKHMAKEIISRGDPVAMSQMAINGNDVLNAGIGIKDRQIVGKALRQAYEWVLMEPECNDKQLLLSRLKAAFGKRNQT
ncbi:MAG: hypothetical protein GX094_10030 [Clostridiales bacterium]|jgi:tRNA nucleotidyltransferase/poly(A) polymerase|nr:hypothetical protein [Clostridiales bacterium]